MKIAIVSGDDVVGEDPEQLGVALTAQGHDATVCFRRNGPRPAKATAGACRSVAVPVGPRAAADAIDVLPYVGDWAAKLERVWSKNNPTSCTHTGGSADWPPSWPPDVGVSRSCRRS